MLVFDHPIRVGDEQVQKAGEEEVKAPQIPELLRLAGQPGGLSGAADSDLEGRLVGHSQGPGIGQA